MCSPPRLYCRSRRKWKGSLQIKFGAFQLTTSTEFYDHGGFRDSSSETTFLHRWFRNGILSLYRVTTTVTFRKEKLQIEVPNTVQEKGTRCKCLCFRSDNCLRTVQVLKVHRTELDSYQILRSVHDYTIHESRGPNMYTIRETILGEETEVDRLTIEQ